MESLERSARTSAWSRAPSAITRLPVTPSSARSAPATYSASAPRGCPGSSPARAAPTAACWAIVAASVSATSDSETMSRRTAIEWLTPPGPSRTGLNRSSTFRGPPVSRRPDSAPVHVRPAATSPAIRSISGRSWLSPMSDAKCRPCRDGRGTSSRRAAASFAYAMRPIASEMRIGVLAWSTAARRRLAGRSVDCGSRWDMLADAVGWRMAPRCGPGGDRMGSRAAVVPNSHIPCPRHD
jgi:hypothetical protein